MQYAAIGMHTDKGTPKTPTVKYFESKNDAERQFYLFCAAAAISEYEVDTAILMTTDGKQLDRKAWYHAQPVPPEPEPEPELVNEG
jgi:predicted peroxiredoxin